MGLYSNYIIHKSWAFVLVTGSTKALRFIDSVYILGWYEFDFRYMVYWFMGSLGSNIKYFGWLYSELVLFCVPVLPLGKIGQVSMLKLHG